MPLYMDLHRLAQGATARDVAQAHMKDVEVQGNYGVRYLTWWFNEAAGRVFCLAEAPSVNAAVRVHRESHGLVPDEIIEVEPGTVEAFLGDIEETPPARDPAAPATDSGLRILLFTDMKGSTSTTQRLGDAQALDLLRRHDAIIREALSACGGSEIKHTGDGIMASFVSVSRAVQCAVNIQAAFADHSRQHPDAPFHVRIGLSAGEPVSEHDDLFGAAVQLARRICDCAQPDHILVSNVVRELALGKGFQFVGKGEAELKGIEELVHLHEVRWTEAAP